MRATLLREWAVETLLALVAGEERFNRIKARLGGLPAKTLSSTLKALARQGLVARRVVSERPKVVAYSLTPIGAEFAAFSIEGLERFSREDGAQKPDARAAGRAGRSRDHEDRR